MSARLVRTALAAVLILGVLPAGVASAAGGGLVDRPEIPIAVAPGGQVQADIDWPWVVYKDGRYDELDVDNDEDHVRLFNMKTGEDFPVSPANVGEWEQANPSIYGNRVVYSDRRNSATTGCDIWMYDIATGKESVVTDAPGRQENPFIYGDIVAWVDWRNHSTNGGYTEIWMKNLATGVEKAVDPIGGASQLEPVVWENYIVWTERYFNSSVRSSIALCDIATNTTTVIAEHQYTDYNNYVHYSDPFISDGNVVIRERDRVDGTDYDSIHLYEIGTGQTTQISIKEGTQRRHPVTRDGWVTWHDYRKTGNSDQQEVYGYDLAAKQEVIIVAAEEDGDWFKYAGPTTTGNGWVIWDDHRPGDGDDGKADLYAKYLGKELPAAVPVAGADRIATAVAASKLAFAPGSVDTVVIATGFNWPDALGGTSLAGALNGPVLLVEQNALPGSVAAEIARLGASRVIILGGANAVSANVAAALDRLPGIEKVERIAGNDRYQTADRIALRVISELGGRYSGMAFVATGENFPDALAAAPLAASKNWPLFLAHPTSGLSSGTRSAMAKVDEAVILGGTAVVPQATQNAIDAMPGKKTTRLSGPDRYATAVAVANYAVTKQGHGWDRVGITTGLNFPDALAGGVVQGEWIGGKKPSVMLLTDPGMLNSRTASALSANKAKIDTITYFGGANAVSNAVRTQANSLIK